MTEHISRETKGNTRIIRINRPDKKNALTGDMYNAMADAFEEGENDQDIKVHLLTGTEGIFTAGNDISDFFERAQSHESGIGGGVFRFLMGQFEWKKPVIAAVDGLAVGIGTTLLFHCDLVYASNRAQFITPFAGLGLTPENASSYVFPRVMGHQRAYELLCLGETFSAEQAKDAGFVNAVVSPDNLELHALGVAEKLAAKPVEALQRAKELLRDGLADLKAVIKKENEIFEQCLRSEEAKNALHAFLTKK